VPSATRAALSRRRPLGADLGCDLVAEEADQPAKRRRSPVADPPADAQPLDRRRCGVIASRNEIAAQVRPRRARPRQRSPRRGRQPRPRRRLCLARRRRQRSRRRPRSTDRRPDHRTRDHARHPQGHLDSWRTIARASLADANSSWLIPSCLQRVIAASPDLVQASRFILDRLPHTKRRTF